MQICHWFVQVVVCFRYFKYKLSLRHQALKLQVEPRAVTTSCYPWTLLIAHSVSTGQQVRITLFYN